MSFFSMATSWASPPGPSCLSNSFACFAAVATCHPLSAFSSTKTSAVSILPRMLAASAGAFSNMPGELSVVA